MFQNRQRRCIEGVYCVPKPPSIELHSEKTNQPKTGKNRQIGRGGNKGKKNGPDRRGLVPMVQGESAPC